MFEFLRKFFFFLGTYGPLMALLRPAYGALWRLMARSPNLMPNVLEDWPVSGYVSLEPEDCCTEPPCCRKAPRPPPPTGSSFEGRWEKRPDGAKPSAGGGDGEGDFAGRGAGAQVVGGGVGEEVGPVDEAVVAVGGGKPRQEEGHDGLVG